MSESKTPSFPFALPFGGEAFRKSVTDAQERWNSVLEQSTKVEAQGQAHLKQMIDESARLAHETLTYWTNLGNEWRKLSAEATKRSMDLFTQR